MTVPSPSFAYHFLRGSTPMVALFAVCGAMIGAGNDDHVDTHREGQVLLKKQLGAIDAGQNVGKALRPLNYQAATAKWTAQCHIKARQTQETATGATQVTEDVDAYISCLRNKSKEPPPSFAFGVVGGFWGGVGLAYLFTGVTAVASGYLFRRTNKTQAAKPA